MSDNHSPISGVNHSVNGGRLALQTPLHDTIQDNAVTHSNKKEYTDTPIAKNICASDIDRTHSTHENTCVPSDEMESAVEDNGYSTVREAADDLQCHDSDTNARDLCILEKVHDRKRVVRYFKTPVKSMSANYWLNNTDIDTTQYHLSTLFTGYYYSNIHMIDFGMFNPDTQDVIQEVKAVDNIDFVREVCKPSDSKRTLTYNGAIKSFGIVVNTDVSSGKGIHWFAVFMDFASTPCTIEYFNSSGYDVKTPKFKSWMISLADDITRAGKPCKYVRVSEIQHQSATTANCGVYSLYYIWSRLHGTPHVWFAKNKVPDSKMELFRKFVFRSA